MSKKRTSAGSCNDEKTTEDSDAVFQQIDDTKRGRFDTLSDTSLQDLPIEMLECILVKAVAMEVKDLKLAKSVWKEKADAVIGRLRTVCSHWSSILDTNFFRNELHRALDGIAQKTIRLEILHQSPIDYFVVKVTTMRDEVFMFCGHFDQYGRTYFNIAVYDRSNITEVKDIIALPGIRPGNIAACNLSNCLYITDQNRELLCFSVLRITRDEKRQFKVQTWISDLRSAISSIYVSDKGSLIIVLKREGLHSHALSIYNPNGFLHHEVMLPPEICRFVTIVTQKANGNLLVASANVQLQTELTEIDTDGIIERQYQSSLSGWDGVTVADSSGRILINDPRNGFELLDSEFNRLAFPGPQPNKDDFNLFYSLNYYGERNGVVGICAVNFDSTVLTIFRFSEE